MSLETLSICLSQIQTKLAHLSSTKLQCLLSLVVGIERTDLVKNVPVLLSLLLLNRQFYRATCAYNIIGLMSLAVFRQRL